MVSPRSTGGNGNENLSCAYGDLTGTAVGEGAELADLEVADGLGEPLDHSPVHRTHHIGVVDSKWLERAVRDGDDRRSTVDRANARPESAVVEFGDKCRNPSGGGSGTPLTGCIALFPAQAIRIGRCGTHALGELHEHRGESRHHRRLDAQRGGTDRDRVPVLGAADTAPGPGIDGDQTGVAHALEVRSHRVRVQRQRLSEFVGGEGGRGLGEPGVNGVPGVIAEHLEHLKLPVVGPEIVHGVRLARNKHGNHRYNPAVPPVTPPTPEDIFGLLRGVIDPELGGNVVDLGMVPSVSVGDDGLVKITVKLTISGCPLRAQIKRDVETRVGSHPGVRAVKIEWGEMTPDERADVMNKARWNARENAKDTAVAPNTRVLAIASGKGGVGKSSVTANLAAALAARGLTVGVLDADIWGFSIPRLLGMSDRLEAEKIDGSDRPLIIPNERRIGTGTLRVVSTGFLVDEETALMWRGLMLTKAVEQFLNDVQWGPLDYLLIDMPPGTGDVQMGLARMLPRTDLIIVTTPALAAQKVAVRAADMARRSFLRVAGVVENMTSFICEHGQSYPLFGVGGGRELADTIGAELLAQIPLEAAVAAGGDTGEPVAIEGNGVAAQAFRSLAEHIVTVAVPPATLAGCSARMLESIELRLGKKPVASETN